MLWLNEVSEVDAFWTRSLDLLDRAKHPRVVDRVLTRGSDFKSSMSYLIEQVEERLSVGIIDPAPYISELAYAIYRKCCTCLLAAGSPLAVLCVVLCVVLCFAYSLRRLEKKPRTATVIPFLNTHGQPGLPYRTGETHACPRRLKILLLIQRRIMPKH